MKKGLFAVGMLLIVSIYCTNNINGQIKNTLKTNTPQDTSLKDTIPPVSDTTSSMDTLAPGVDTFGRTVDILETSQDTSIWDEASDTLKPVEEDTTAIEEALTGREIRDTVEVIVRDTIIVTRHDTVTRYLLDAVVPEPQSRLDSAIALVQRHAVMDTTTLINDTTRRFFQRLLFYARSQPVDSTMDFVEQYLQADTSDTTARIIADSDRKALNDSLFRSLNYIWEKSKTDSIQFTVFNRTNDSINLWLTKRPGDSSRFLLYDDKDYPAGIWINPLNQQSIELSFVDEVRIEEVETQQTLHEYLPVSIEELGLQQQEQINMVFPQWDIDGIGRAHFNQGYLSNWARGGESSLSTLWTLRYSADYKKGKTIWDNDLEYKVGLLKSGTKSLRKNEDKLEINSKFGTNAKNNWYYSALLNFQTQFFKGYNYPNTDEPISGFLAPGYLVFSIGMDYKPNNKLTILLSPISSKFTFMRDTSKFDQTNFGIPQAKKSKGELGAYVKSIFNIDFTDKISMENKVNLFINYLERRETLDIDYEVTLNMKINELINTTINTHLVYDRDISNHIQFKENLSVGLQYKF
jgi:hypothetical protein